MATFDLVTEPWIPVMERGHPAEVGIGEALDRGGEIDGIVDPSPLVTFALHRLLIAILHSAFRGPSSKQWSGWWREGWDAGAVAQYLDAQRERFDLFQGERPFYQTARIKSEPSGIQRLSHELGPANADHFSHVRLDTSLVLTPAQAARFLLAYQIFSPGGLVGYQKGESGREYKSARGAPLLNTAGCLLTGDTLARTLLLNMVTYDPGREMPYAGHKDKPAWERDVPVEVRERLPDGYLDWLTWQCRRIRLITAEGTNQTMVDRVLIMNGNQLPKGALEADYEKMAAYRKVAKPAAGQAPYRPIGFRRDRAVWRDSLALFTSTEGKSVGTVKDLGEREEITEEQPLDLLGVSTNQFNAEFWRHERLPLEPAYLRDRLLRDRLAAALELAEASAGALNRATKRMCEFLLSPEMDAEGRKPDAEAVSAMVEQLAPGRRYWSRLETRFDRFLRDQPGERIEDEWGEPTYGRTALTLWADRVRDAAGRSFQEAARDLGTGGWTLKAAVRARGWLERDLREARKRAGIEDERKESAA